MKLILLNGPPRAGKDTASLAIEGALHHMGFTVIHEKFSRPLKTAFAGMMNVRIDEDFVVEHYEARKDEVIPALGVSFRQWQIDYSERFMKSLYGQDVFARLLLDRLGEPDTRRSSLVQGQTKVTTVEEVFVVVSDCGFQIEVDTILKSPLVSDSLLIRVHREGRDYKNDSRGPVRHPRPDRDWDTINTGTVEQFGGRVLSDIVLPWAGRPIP